MNQTVRAVKISDHVYWVGAMDWSIRDFHGYDTSRGTTYNAYLVTGKKNILIDTVKRDYVDELISRVQSVVPLEDIDYIISNHAEPDHSGALDIMIEKIKPEKIFASKMGVKALKEHFLWNVDVTPVEDGSEIILGDLTFRFYETRMLHWPDSMFSFLVEDNLLFSQDAFGMHLASSERFIDQCDSSVVKYEAAKYFANILLPYAPLISKLLEKMQKLGLDPSIVAPDHGPIWRGDSIADAVSMYTEWTQQKMTRKVVVIYDTMWGATKKMAQSLADTFAEKGLYVKVLPLKGVHRSNVITEIFDAGAVLIGSPTLNNNLFPTLADVLTYCKGLKPRNLIGAAFGSYGWSGEAVPQLKKIMEDMGIEFVGSCKAKYGPSENDIQCCRDLADDVYRVLIEKTSTSESH
ncbi:MAG: FprA family A-type flavoprotein [Deltaproteobacteria bacterium]|nr:FprA family A-type flavoprotein [Deltaproteobacteria bacterium]